VAPSAKARHPDAGGTHELFIWAQALREHLAAPLSYGHASTPHHRHSASESDGEPDRVDFTWAFGESHSFSELTVRAIQMAGDVPSVYGRLLEMLGDCFEAASDDPTTCRQQHQGATYRSLAAVAYKASMSKAERVGWYRLAESIPLSQRHVGHIMARLQEEAA
jgi:hypothetical protein